MTFALRGLLCCSVQRLSWGFYSKDLLPIFLWDEFSSILQNGGGTPIAVSIFWLLQFECTRKLAFVTYSQLLYLFKSFIWLHFFRVSIIEAYEFVYDALYFMVQQIIATHTTFYRIHYSVVIENSCLQFLGCLCTPSSIRIRILCTRGC